MKRLTVIGLTAVWFALGVTPMHWLIWLSTGALLGLFLTWWVSRPSPAERRLRQWMKEHPRPKPPETTAEFFIRMNSPMWRRQSAPPAGRTARRRSG